jgi:DNA-binding PadR family transcriptional regulator
LPVKHAVLGLLVERRGYAYEVSQRLDERLGPHLAVTEGTVHSAMKTLRNAGHIEEVRRSWRGAQAAVWHAATDAGAAHYDEWMNETVAREPVRGELYLKFAMIDTRRLPRLREQFERLERECVADIAMQTRGRPLGDTLTDPVSMHTAAMLLIESAALDRLTGDLRFIKRTLTVLRWAETQGAVPRATLLEAVSS